MLELVLFYWLDEFIRPVYDNLIGQKFCIEEISLKTTFKVSGPGHFS